MSAPLGSTGIEPASEGLRAVPALRERAPSDTGGHLLPEGHQMKRPLQMTDCKKVCVT